MEKYRKEEAFGFPGIAQARERLMADEKWKS